MNSDKNKKTVKRKKIKFGFVFLRLFPVVFCMLILAFFGRSFSSLIEDGVEVEELSELTYYLTISYDGIDKNGIISDSTTVSEMYSGILSIEDKIPDGLEFLGFITSSDGSFGAVKRSDKNASCPGKVIDDTNESGSNSGVWNSSGTEYTYHGLHYNASTRTVTFQVRDLQAGCELVVGIKTKTPTIDDPNTPELEMRRDFYNFATGRDGGLTTNSNTVHVFMGRESEPVYNVIYRYTGVVPTGAPNEPESSSYAEGTSVGVASNVEVEGYTFSGWSTDDANVVNGSFKMPDNDVVFVGSFEKRPSYMVTYSLKGTAPTGYILPPDKQYYPESIVELSDLKVGDTFNGYRFLGWKSEDVVLNNDGYFTMPSKDVHIVGEFEEITYQVIYKFHEGDLPPNANQYLPETKSYRPGTIVKLEEITDEPEGFEFMGWYGDSEFEMPEKDVIIYGEWKIHIGTFAPTITKVITNPKAYYRVGEYVDFKITVKNTASFTITDVSVSENNDHSVFLTNSNYTVLSDHIVKIDSIEDGASVDLYAVYKVTNEDKGTIRNEVEILGALGGTYYQLDDKKIKADVTFKVQSKIKVCNNVSSTYNENVFQFLVTGVDNHYETWLTLVNGECKTITVDPSTYKVREIVPQEYTLKSVTGAITSNNASFVVAEGNDYEILFTNEFIKKGFFHSFGRVVNKIVQRGEMNS